MKGRTDLTGYFDKVIDGVTYQTPVPATIQFHRHGTSKISCSGHLIIWFDDITDPRMVDPLTYMTALLYGVEPTIPFLLVQDDDRVGVIAPGFATDDCDTIFSNAGGLTWGEVFNGEGE